MAAWQTRIGPPLSNLAGSKEASALRFGSIKAAVWRNDTETGVRYNVTFSRLYKEGDQWKSTESFGRDDLLLLGKVANDAHSWICQRSQEQDDSAKAAVLPPVSGVR